MFYHGKLLNGKNVIKNEFRPPYLNGSNTEKLPIERLETFIDDNSDVKGLEISTSTSSSTSSTTSSSIASMNTGNQISSFQDTLNRMKNAANNKIQKDVNDKKEKEKEKDKDKEKEKDIEREKKFSNVTLKPFLFFDLLTSKDSSSQNREVSQSLSNIGKNCLILASILSYFSFPLLTLPSNFLLSFIFSLLIMTEEAKLCINILETLIVQARNKQVRLGPVGTYVRTYFKFSV